jgi:hypothetical protein
MGWIVNNIDWILIVSGLGTCSVVSMALAPSFAMRSFFGVVEQGPVVNLIARSWGVMVFCAGLMMVYAAYHAEARLPILLYAIAGKMSFVAMVAATPVFRRQMAAILALLDLLIVALLGWYLLAVS